MGTTPISGAQNGCRGNAGFRTTGQKFLVHDHVF